MGSISIVNKRFHTPTEHDVYIGRGSLLGNPFSHLESKYDTFLCKDRQEAINRYEAFIYSKMDSDGDIVANELKRLAEIVKTNNINLVCHCKHPSRDVQCHGDIIKNIIENEF
jgi:uncharacterized protein YeaO (DUF488 family)